ncbi:unnamed protein product [Somion occarium]|uniref:Uncharacterized protein n=1 Tax=Somion occarium TaxID=3059160 RepID=A0ABP1E7Q8_9APHY
MVNVSPDSYGAMLEPDNVFHEKTWLAAGYLAGLGFGLQFALYCFCLRAFRNRRKLSLNDCLLIGCMTVLCFVNGCFTAANAYGLQLTFIDARNYPGGSWALMHSKERIPSAIMSDLSYHLTHFLADGVLLIRCRIVWVACVGSKATYYMLFPSLLLITSFALAIMYMMMCSSPLGIFNEMKSNLATSSFVVSLSLNITLTVMIAYRIWSTLKSCQSQSSMKYYGSVPTILVESAGLCAFSSTLLLIAYGMDHPIKRLWLALNPSMQTVSIYLIVRRIAQGKAWTIETLASAATPFDGPFSLTYQSGQADNEIELLSTVVSFSSSVTHM